MDARAVGLIVEQVVNAQQPLLAASVVQLEGSNIS